jgi:GDP-L-fucose synthase
MRLLEEGHSVTVVDSLAPGTGAIDPFKQEWHAGNPNEFKGFTFLHQDCRQFFKVTQPFNFELIIHLAAIVGGRLVIERNPLAVAEDLEIDSAFWRWVSVATDSHVIGFSSSAAYPISLQTKESHRPLKESDIAFTDSLGVPDLSYGWAKLTSEFLGRLTHEKHGIKITSYRPFSGYGPDQDLCYPFPSIMKRAIEHDETSADFQVWGSGFQERDFIHIKDVVENVLDTYLQVTDGSSLNLGSGIATNFITLSESALKILGKGPEVKGMSIMPEGVFSRVADVELSHKSYGMKNSIPLLAGIEDGLKFWN